MITTQTFPIVSQEYQLLKTLIKSVISYYQGPDLPDENFEGFFSIFTECGHILDVLPLLNSPRSMTPGLVTMTMDNKVEGDLAERLQLSDQVIVSCHQVIQVLKQLKGCESVKGHGNANNNDATENSSTDALIKSLQSYKWSDILSAIYKLLFVLDDWERVGDHQCELAVIPSKNNGTYITKYPGKNSMVRDLIEHSTLFNCKNGLEENALRVRDNDQEA